MTRLWHKEISGSRIRDLDAESSTGWGLVSHREDGHALTGLGVDRGASSGVGCLVIGLVEGRCGLVGGFRVGTVRLGLGLVYGGFQVYGGFNQKNGRRGLGD